MRKNAVNKQLHAIDGGVCAVAGFKANTVRCGYDSAFLTDDVGLIYSDKKCAVAFLGNATPMQGAPVKVSRHHASFSYVRGVLFNNAVANVYGDGSERLCTQMCWEVARRLRVDGNNFIIASTGKIGKPLPLEPFIKMAPNLVAGLDFTKEKDDSLAKALCFDNPKQLAFAFELGAFTCKIGAVFKGNSRVAPNMATTLCFITTDVNISPEMLQKALTVAVNDTFNQLCIDCIPSPNDCVCIMANGKAGNYKISVEDTEYKKFVFALTETVDRICKSLVSNEKNGETAFLCKVTGARSKKLARDVSKAIISASGIKERLAKGEVEMADVYGAILSANETVDESFIGIALANDTAKIKLMEEGNVLFVQNELIRDFLALDNGYLEISLGTGNYSATGYGRRKRVNEN